MKFLFLFSFLYAGATLKANNLEIVDTLMTSSTGLYASAAAWANPAKRARIEELKMLLQSVLEARKRLMLTFNVVPDLLDSVIHDLPAYVLFFPSQPIPPSSHLCHLVFITAFPHLSSSLVAFGVSG